MITQYRDKQKLAKYKRYSTISTACLVALSGSYVKCSSEITKNALFISSLPLLGILIYFSHLEIKENLKKNRILDEINEITLQIDTMLTSIINNSRFIGIDSSLTTLSSQCNTIHAIIINLESNGLESSNEYKKLVQKLKSALELVLSSYEKFNLDIYKELESIIPNNHNKEHIDNLYALLDRNEVFYNETQVQHALITEKFNLHCQKIPQLKPKLG